MSQALSVGTVGFIGSQFNYGGDIYGQIYNEPDQTRRVALQLASIVLLEDWIDGVPSGIDGNKMMVFYSPSEYTFDLYVFSSLLQYSIMRYIALSWTHTK